ncbi:MAG: hypothetical protein ACI4VK_02345 [Candidatus Coproplasma sp.]
MEYSIKFADSAPVPAKVRRAGEVLTVLYRLNDTDFLLKIDGERVVHKTLGDGLEIEFVHGRRCVGRLKCGSNSAPYEVYCSLLEVKDFGSGKNVTVVFDDGDGLKRVDISLIANNDN